MAGWDVEMEQEVQTWVDSLDTVAFEVAEAHIDLLAEFGAALRMPHSRPLGDGLFELRFEMARRSWRVTYWFAPATVIVALTVFAKQRNNEKVEVRRAKAAMVRCQREHQ